MQHLIGLTLSLDVTPYSLMLGHCASMSNKTCQPDLLFSLVLNPSGPDCEHVVAHNRFLSHNISCTRSSASSWLTLWPWLPLPAEHTLEEEL